MCELLTQCERKARKRHKCDYCGAYIEPGEVYNYATLKYDGIYDWKSHKECSYIVSELWNYMDPDGGVTDEDFQNACGEFCDTFICPDCESCKDGEHDGCYYCLHKIYECLQKNELVRTTDDHGWTQSFKLREKKTTVINKEADHE